MYRCMLTDRDATERLDDDRALAERVLHTQRTADGVRVTVDGSRELVDTFVEHESRCCGFFDFTVTENEDTVTLEITAPPDETAQRLVDEAERTFREGPRG
ncbi:MAG: hypothetical protein KY437_08960 [Actinobacteria bacterium]|nr:hypothetical protein [Actinomycetota bacterium]